MIWCRIFCLYICVSIDMFCIQHTTFYAFMECLNKIQIQIVAQLVKKNVIFKGTHSFITILTTPLYWPVFWASSIQSTSYCNKILLNNSRSLKQSHPFRISDQNFGCMSVSPLPCMLLHTLFTSSSLIWPTLINMLQTVFIQTNLEEAQTVIH